MAFPLLSCHYSYSSLYTVEPWRQMQFTAHTLSLVSKRTPRTLNRTDAHRRDMSNISWLHLHFENNIIMKELIVLKMSQVVVLSKRKIMLMFLNVTNQFRDDVISNKSDYKFTRSLLHISPRLNWIDTHFRYFQEMRKWELRKRCK